MRGHLHVVKALLDKGATPNVVNKLYKTPLLTVHNLVLPVFAWLYTPPLSLKSSIDRRRAVASDSRGLETLFLISYHHLVHVASCNASPLPDS